MNNKSFKTFFWSIFSLSPAIFFSLFYVILLSIENYRLRVLYDSDINWLLKTGEYIFTHNFVLPQTDIYSYTNPHIVWVLYQWLFEVILYFSYSLSFFQGIGSFVTIIFALTFTVLYVLLRKNNVGMLFSLVALGLGAWTSVICYYARPAIMTYLFICCLLLLFNLAENKNTKYLYIIPFIFLLWANLHLGFPSGIFIFIIYLSIQLVKYLYNKTQDQFNLLKTTTIALILSFIFTLINPYGIDLYSYLLNLASSDYMNNNIKELLSPNFHIDFYRPMLILIFGIFVLSHFIRKVPFYYIICLTISAILTLIFVRNIPFFGIFACIVFAIQLQSACDEVCSNEKIHPIIKFPFEQLNRFNNFEKEILTITPKPTKINLSAIAIPAFILIIVATMNYGFNQKYFKFSLNYIDVRPVQAFDFVLINKPPGKFFSEGTWGSYAIFRIPKYKVFIDSRFDMYGEDFFRTVHEINLGKGDWNKILDKYDVNWIVTPISSPLALQINTMYNKKWFSAYKDKTAQIFMRENKTNREWFKKIKPIKTTDVFKKNEATKQSK